MGSGAGSSAGGSLGMQTGGSPRASSTTHSHSLGGVPVLACTLLALAKHKSRTAMAISFFTA